jgi:hemerythrin-like domain-containing protein
MRATEILMNEHRVIEQMLSVVDAMADLALRTRTVNPQSAAQSIDFIRTFADRCHHAKEEDVLFVRMETAGFPNDNGPIAVMRHDHDPWNMRRTYVHSSLPTIEPFRERAHVVLALATHSPAGGPP